MTVILEGVQGQFSDEELGKLKEVDGIRVLYGGSFINIKIEDVELAGLVLRYLKEECGK